LADANYREGDDVPSGALYRRIYPHRDYFKPPPENRPTSLNFLPDKNEAYLSMFRAAEVSPSEALANHEGFGLLEINAETLWAIGVRVIYQPSKGKGHVGVSGFTKKDAQPRRDAATAARVLIAPRLSDPS
jgi:hypothetical protein